MVGGISKRQQYRNERALQDLIRSVPGNDRCADCQAMNPGWASWNIGIFLCMRCAALHRKLGTHISKVKSLSMDSWTDDQVDNMKSHGNNIMNKIFNPKNVKPPVPTDVDESDSCMERFIRQKYQHRSLDENKQKPPSRHDSGYDRSPEGSPPPLPPKPARPFGFGLRSASSATNLNRISNRSASSPQSDRFDSPSPALGARKASGDASFDSKLATLRDMGFTNERRNAIALRELNGNLDKTIETLVRLGEGNGSVVRPPASASASTPSVDFSKFGNPFDQLDSRPAAQPSSNFNPFDAQPQPQPPPQQQQQQQQQQQLPQSASMQPLEQSFQGLQVAQPLFPHSTGGYPYRQSSLPQPLYQQAPSAASTLNQGGYIASPQIMDGSHNPFFQTGAQPQASLTTPGASPNPNLGSSNPFFGQVPSQQPSMQAQNQASAGPFGPPRHANTMPIMSATSPFGQPSPFQQQQQQQQLQPQPQQQAQPQLQAPPTQPGQNSMNPFQMMNAPPTPQSAGYPAPAQYGYQMPAQQLYPQHTARVDKNSILALYNLSPQPPTIPEHPQIQQPPVAANPAQQVPMNPAPPSHYQQPAPALQQPGATDPQATGTRNPFFTAAPAAPAAPYQMAMPQPAPPPTAGFTMNNRPATSAGGFPRGHMSQQSVDINGFQSGRHSPDAFASLSARYG